METENQFKIKPVGEEKPIVSDMLGPQQKKESEEPIPETPPEEPAERFIKRKYFYWGLTILVIVFIIIAAVSLILGLRSFLRERVELEISAEEVISSGDEVVFTVNYKNNNRVALKEAKLIFEYPESTVSLEGEEISREEVPLGVIPKKKGGSLEFKARIIGERSSIKYAVCKLIYQPENISSFYENSTSFGITIGSQAIELKLNAPQGIISGEKVSYYLDYANISEMDFSNLQIKAVYPLGFSFVSSEPEPEEEENNIWFIKDLKKDESGEITIEGILQGEEGDNKALKVSLGKMENGKFLVYQETSASTEISSFPLLLSLTLNGETDYIANAGEVLSYKIRFKNNTDIALSELILRAKLDGAMFDFKTLELDRKGFFDSRNNTISWSAVDLPLLSTFKPNEEGEVGFEIKLKDEFPVKTPLDKNFTVGISAELETLSIPAQFALDKLEIKASLVSKINSLLILTSKGYFNEPTAGITNSGPIPPKVNETTTYTIHWQVINSSNDLERVIARGVLPSGIEWTNQYLTSFADTGVQYNERTNEIVWNIGRLPATTGLALPQYELIFQIAFTPSISQVGETPTLINTSSIEGKDTFTGLVPKDSAESFTTKLPDDSTIDREKGTVIE